jgi:hypothetical protein
MSVLFSKDYTRFKHLDGNRRIVAPHLKRLKASMEKKYLFSPILINEKHEIIDGQHRFEACKELGLPIYYMIKRGYGLEEVQTLNSNLRNWNNEDYMNGYIELGYEDYKLYKMFREEFGFDHHSCLWMLGDTAGMDKGEIWQKFKDGEFKIKDYKVAVQNAEKIKMLSQFYKGYYRRSFVAAMLKCFKNNAYNHGVFMKKISYQSTKLVDCTTTSEYLTLIEEIYNYKARDRKVNLRFPDNNSNNVE